MSLGEIGKQWISEQAGEQAQVTYLDYKKIKGFEDVGHLLQAYVVDGGDVTKNIQRNDVIDAASITVSLNNDMMKRDGASFQTTVPLTTYYLDFSKDGDWTWATTHPIGSVGVDYLTIAAVTTDSNAMVNVITDARVDMGGIRFKEPIAGYATSEQLAETETKVYGLFNVKEFGAIGDGSSHPLSDFYGTLAEAQVVYPKATALTDEIDWAAIQKSVDTVFGQIRVPVGHYLINKRVDIGGGIRLTGDGNSVTSIRPTANSAYLNIISGATRTVIEDLYIIPNGTGVTADYGIRIEGSTSYYRVSNVRIVQVGQIGFAYGIYTGNNAISGTFENVFMQQCTKGFSVGDESNNVRFDKCVVIFCGDGAEIRGGGRGRVFDTCLIELNTNDGITTLNAGDVQIVNTYFERNGRYDIWTQFGSAGLDSLYVSGCQFYKNVNGTSVRLNMAQNSNAAFVGNNFAGLTGGTYTPYDSQGFSRAISINDSFKVYSLPILSATMCIIKRGAFVGRVGMRSVYKSANFTFTDSDQDTTYRVDATSGNVTITLPNLVPTGGAPYQGYYVEIVRWDNSANNVTITASNGSVINNKTLTNADRLKIYRICYNRVDGTSNEWILLGG